MLLFTKRYRRLLTALPPSPLPWTQRRAAVVASTTIRSSSPTQSNISENNIILTRNVLSKSNNSFLAYGVAASTAAAVIIHQNRGYLNETSVHQKWSGITRRYYHETAHCESKNGSNNQKQQTDSQGKEDSDSFFDLAQQWANEVLLSKSNGAKSAGEKNNGGTKQNSVPSSADIATPEEALLYKLGLMGNKSSTDHSKDNDDRPSTSKSNLQDRNGVTYMMQSVFNKIQDEIKSSIPNPSSSTDPTNPSVESSPSNQQQTDATKSSDFLSFADNISSFFSRKSSNPDIAEIIQQAQSIANNDGASSTLSSPSSSSSGFLSQVLYFQQNAKSIQKTLESSFGPYISDDINLSDLFQSIPSIAAAHYYLEHQDSIKTPSWKRRKHRFQPSVEVMKVNELNEALILSELSYADSVEEVREGLERLYDDDWSDVEGGVKSKKKGESKTSSRGNKAQWELLFCDTQSRPNEPSHFLAIQKNASQYDDTLHILMVVRGTKSMGDLLTDAMMEATDYEYDGVRGKAHVGITRSGSYLTKRHKKLLATLLQLSDKRKLDITLIGHSLGAGAATIAAMNMMNSNEFASDIGNDVDYDVKVSANVIGFGCPALLSRDLSVMTRDFVTTVIADADVIPRMSGATLINLLLDLNQFGYQDLAERDVEQALRELQGRFTDSSTGNRQSNKQLPFSIDEDAIQKVMGYVHRGIEKVTGEEEDVSMPSGKNEGAEKMIPCLFPPGTCIHFYRDGSGIDGTYVPCTFFDEIDVARTMVDDHLISSGYRRIFLNMMRDFHKDDHFSFERRRV